MSEYSPRPAIRVTVCGENLHEKRDELVQKLYPDGMHNTIAEGISDNLGERAALRVDYPRPARARSQRRGPGAERTS